MPGRHHSARSRLSYPLYAYSHCLCTLPTVSCDFIVIFPLSGGLVLWKSAFLCAKDEVKTIRKPQERKKVWVIVIIAGVIAAAVAAWPSTITGIVSYSFLPHGFCHMWNKQLLSLHVVSDSFIFVSCFTIAWTIVWLLRCERQNLPFTWIFLAFGAFIVACGFTHAMDVVVLWLPLYWLSGDIKFITAIASVITAIALPVLMPKIRLVLKQSTSARLNELRFVGAAECSLDCLYLAGSASIQKQGKPWKLSSRTQTPRCIRRRPKEETQVRPILAHWS